MSKRKQLNLFEAFAKKVNQIDSTTATDKSSQIETPQARETETVCSASSSYQPAPAESLTTSDDPDSELQDLAIGSSPPHEPLASTSSHEPEVLAPAASSSLATDDIGNIKADELKSASDSIKLNALQNRFRPQRGWVAPSKCIFGKQRKIPDEFFNETLYPTLRYSKSKDGIFCVACMLFSSGDQILRTKPLSDWSNAKKIVSKHLATQAHQSAQLRAAEFLHICTGKSQSICAALDRSYQDTTERNKNGVKAIIDLIAVCGQQNIPIRGHTDERGNFQAILNYRADGDEALKQYLQLAPSNANYCGHQVQNELIELCGKQIQNAILEKCRKAQWFSVLSDETADISNSEQVSILVRYVDSDSGGKNSVREDFLCFVSTADTTGETLTKVLLDKLNEFDLDPVNMVGQGYDGAGNVSGKVRGVQARVKQLYPAATYVHCRNHALNLAIVHSTRIPLVRNTLGSVQDMVSFMTASPKRLQCFLSDSTTKQCLRKFSDTRWSQHDACLSTVIENYENMFVTMGRLKTEGDPKSCNTASSLFRAMESFDFIISIIVIQGLLQYLTPLSNSLQNPACDLPKASSNASALVTVFENKREDTTFGRMWDKACALATKVDVTPSVPRTVTMQTKRSNTPAATPEEYWRRNLYLPFIDHLTTEVRERVCLALPRLKGQYLLPDKLSVLSDSDTLWHEIKEEYGALMPNVDAADVELELWTQFNSTEPSSSDMCEVLQNTAAFYPNIHCVLKVLLTMPVSTASAERSFSSLRRLKTYLRSTMTDTRLTGLALMNIHHDIKIDSERVLQEFDATGRRRVNFK